MGKERDRKGLRENKRKEKKERRKEEKREERGERAGMGKLKIFGLHGDDFLRG